jgi:hypothetical protein
MLIPTTVARADDDDDDDDVGAACAKETDKALDKSLVICPDFYDDTNAAVGNGFPWENSMGFFATFRNQYLYTSDDVSQIACTMEGISARSSSFTGGSTNVYTSFSNGDPSFVDVGTGLGSLSTTFSINYGADDLCRLEGTNATPITISTTTGVRGSTISVCASCPGADYSEKNGWCQLGDVSAGLPGGGLGVLVDMNLAVGSGNSGAGVWDTHSTDFGGGSECGGDRAYGSGAFANPNWLTTALAVDSFDFVWVFPGLAPPPPATVEQQIAEIIRLLLTPEGLRCSGLDTTSGNGKIEDDPVQFPAGANVDPISPQIGATDPGSTTTGDETVDGLRSGGFRP